MALITASAKNIFKMSKNKDDVVQIASCSSPQKEAITNIVQAIAAWLWVAGIKKWLVHSENMLGGLIWSSLWMLAIDWLAGIVTQKGLWNVTF